MALPVEPPLAPMLARLQRELPLGDFLYEPKWDGFRCLVFRDEGRIDLRSRHDRPLARYSRRSWRVYGRYLRTVSCSTAS